jgi:hypothetical protein
LFFLADRIISPITRSCQALFNDVEDFGNDSGAVSAFLGCCPIIKNLRLRISLISSEVMMTQ